MESTRDRDRVTHELQPGVLLQCARQQAGFAQDLEAVADAEHRPAVPGERVDRGHDRREAGDRTRAQVVAVGEATRQDERRRRSAARRSVAVPHDLGLATERRRPPRPRRPRSSCRGTARRRRSCTGSTRDLGPLDDGVRQEPLAQLLRPGPWRRPRRRPRP